PGDAAARPGHGRAKHVRGRVRALAPAAGPPAGHARDRASRAVRRPSHFGRGQPLAACGAALSARTGGRGVGGRAPCPCSRSSRSGSRPGGRRHPGGGCGARSRHRDRPARLRALDRRRLRPDGGGGHPAGAARKDGRRVLVPRNARIHARAGRRARRAGRAAAVRSRRARSRGQDQRRRAARRAGPRRGRAPPPVGEGSRRAAAALVDLRRGGRAGQGGRAVRRPPRPPPGRRDDGAHRPRGRPAAAGRGALPGRLRAQPRGARDHGGNGDSPRRGRGGSARRAGGRPRPPRARRSARRTAAAGALGRRGRGSDRKRAGPGPDRPLGRAGRMTYGELKMKSTQVILAGFGALWFLSAGAVRAQTPAEPAAAPEGQEEVSKSEASPADAPKSLEEKVEELDQKVRVLDRKAEIDKEAEAEKAKTGAQATANAKDGFSLKSNDGAFLLKLRGYVQLDGRFYSDDRARPATDTFILRRVRPILEGTVFGKFDFRIMPDFGAGTTVLQDAYLDARFTPSFKVRAGKFKVPVGLERLQSGSDILFVERGFPTNLVPNRDLGIQVHGDLATGTVNYQVGVFNGVPDGASADVDSDSGKDVAARLFFQPFVNGVSAAKNFGFGLAASSGSPSGTVSSPGLASYKTPGQ